jgi:RimJ/RimL family protein N-acetyltransferase
MKTIILRPADPERDFGQIDALFSLEQGEQALDIDLKSDYEIHKERIFCLMVAEDEAGELVGFNWATRSRHNANQAYFFIIVKPELRRQGAGRRLYENVEQAPKAARIKQLQIIVRDTCPECRAFAERRGFTARSHDVGLVVDLETFDDRPYDEIIAKFKGEGFQFTSMEALGNTEEAQRKLYLLNDSTAMEMIVPEDEHSWLSFYDFQKKVCQTDWYRPGGQMIAIDTATGDWAAMSAITRYTGGDDDAYNLHTGVDKRYHGRKLAQAILVLALRYARDVLKVKHVHSEENALNLPALAIYRDLCYTQMAGTFSMEKILE